MLFGGDVDVSVVYTWWIGWLFDREGRSSLSVDLDGSLVARSSSLGNDGSMAAMAAVMPRLPVGFAGDAPKSIDGLVSC